MKKEIKKSFILLLVLVSILSAASPAFTVATNPVMPTVIYETKNSKHLSSGVEYSNILKFTTKGWWNINVLRVNLKDEYTEVKGLFSKKGISNREKVSTMVKDSGALGGINGDFFEYNPIPHSLGALINDGDMISSPMSKDYALPAFVLDENNNPSLNYFNKKLAAVSSATNSEVILSAVNKASEKYEEIMLYNRHWGQKSIGNKLFNDMIEVVVENDVVTDVRVGQEAVNIPEDGYILTGRGRVKDTLLNNFHVGDTVELKLSAVPDYTDLDLDKIKFAIGGGSRIVENGKTINSNLNIKGDNPRTGLGITQDGNELLMVTIDGRDTSFKGVSQEVFSQIMKDLGAYNALVLDGGGSTTMAVRALDEQTPTVVNKPSDGTERKVVDGVGVFSNPPQGTLAYLTVTTDDSNMFPETTRKFSVKGYDQYYNPIAIDQSLVKYTVSGIDGTFNGNVLKANSSGTGKVTASYNGITGTYDIKVLGKVMDITTDLTSFSLDINSQKNLSVFHGKDKDGYKAIIYPEDLNFTAIGNIGYVEKGIFYSNSNGGKGAITAKLGEGVENILVSIGGKGVLVESFDNMENFSSSTSPETTKGSIASSDEAKEGNKSLSLQYDFTLGENTRAAYVNFIQNGGNGRVLDGTPSKLGLWVYGDENGGWLRGNIVDKTGKSINIDFSKSIDWSGWQYVTADIPQGIEYPVTLKKIYIVEVDSPTKYSGEILLDGLSAVYPPSQSGSLVLPASSTLKDDKNVAVKKEANGYTLGITAVPQKLNELVGYAATDKIKGKMNNFNTGIYLGGTTQEFQNGLKNSNIINVSSGYKHYKLNNLLIIKADSSKGGLRASNSEQWLWLKNDLENSQEKNIILVLPTPVFGNGGFADKLEADLLHDTLKTVEEKGKNVWVLQGGSQNSTDLNDGIRYIEFDSREAKNPQDIYNIMIGEFTVNGDNITYQIKPAFEKPAVK